MIIERTTKTGILGTRTRYTITLAGGRVYVGLIEGHADRIACLIDYLNNS